jgi:hypothetical protein
MKLNLKRIIKTVLITGIGAAILAYDYKERHELSSWESVLTTRFWILAILHLIPLYFVAWSFEDHYESSMEYRIFLGIIAFCWAIVLGIIWLLCHFILGFDLL